jgi:hypothetical protein
MKTNNYFFDFLVLLNKDSLNLLYLNLYGFLISIGVCGILNNLLILGESSANLSRKLIVCVDVQNKDTAAGSLALTKANIIIVVAETYLFDSLKKFLNKCSLFILFSNPIDEYY